MLRQDLNGCIDCQTSFSIARSRSSFVELNGSSFRFSPRNGCFGLTTTRSFLRGRQSSSYAAPGTATPRLTQAPRSPTVLHAASNTLHHHPPQTQDSCLVTNVDL